MSGRSNWFRIVSTLLLAGCGQVSEDGSAGGASGGTPAGGSGGQGGSAAGASTGGVGGSVSSGGAVAAGGFAGGGSGGASGTGGGRPPWKPELPLGEPGWRNSTTPFCSEKRAILAPRIWSDESAVYALIRHDCNEFATGYPCSEPGAGETLYRNDGSSWSRIYSRSGEVSEEFADGVTGLSDGSVVLYGATGCPVRLVRGAMSECVLKPGDIGRVYAAAAVADRLYLLADAPGGAEQVVVEYASGQAAAIAMLTSQQHAEVIAAGTSAVAVAGINQLVMAGAPGALAALAGTPAGDYTSVWVDAADGLVLGNFIGHLVRYDGAWKVIDTGVSDLIVGLWGASDGTIYFITQSQFGRVVNDSVEMFTMPGAIDASHYFVDIWGNSSTEVFVTINDRDYGVHECGSTFMVWFDGQLFHEF